jgi:hypothetical protein
MGDNAELSDVSFGSEKAEAIDDVGTWMVWLDGDRDQLKSLCRIFNEGPRRILQEGDGYVLCCDRFKDSDSEDEVFGLADSELEVMLGAASLTQDEHFNVSTACLLAWTDGNGIKHFLAKHSTFIGVELGCTARLYSQLDSEATSTALSAAKNDRHLDQALRLWGEKSRTWSRLYRIFEEICLSLDSGYTGKGKPYPCAVLTRAAVVESRNDCHRCCGIWRFMYSANQPLVSGHDSRHASGAGTYPREFEECPQKKMSHEEAVEFVKAILKRALQKKVEGSML